MHANTNTHTHKHKHTHIHTHAILTFLNMPTTRGTALYYRSRKHVCSPGIIDGGFWRQDSGASHQLTRHDSLTCDMPHSSFICGMTHGHVQYFIHMPMRCVNGSCRWISSVGITHSYVACLIHMRHDALTYDNLHPYVTWLIDMSRASFICDMTHSYVWHDLLTYVTRLMDMRRASFICDMTHSYVWHDSLTYVTWLMDMWHHSFIRQYAAWLGVAGEPHAPTASKDTPSRRYDRAWENTNAAGECIHIFFLWMSEHIWVCRWVYALFTLYFF